ncbi:uncharacterized protein LOC131234578 [Magnolia sinica]|uniref:uncharacterized protein LOC131234578 n=1 Tax=Magnolia sinica TaxID=86752 RepID=UPI002659D815|nr:uncharacterized protein LOC131234578 [Magnolia sinica]
MANLNNSDSDTDDENEKAIVLFTTITATTSAATMMCNAASMIVATIAQNYMEEDGENDIRESRNWTDCIGVIDGTYVLAKIPVKDQGSGADSHILASARTCEGKLPLPKGKYYLVDAGFPNTPGFLAPYRGVRYHLKEFKQGCLLRDKEELFNLHYSSLRNAIEHAFGVLKARFPILKNTPNYPIETQTKIVIACYIIHNHIINERSDVLLNDSNDISYDTNEGQEYHSCADEFHNGTIEMEESDSDVSDEEIQTEEPTRRERDDWSQFRDSLAEAMYENYNSNIGFNQE